MAENGEMNYDDMSVEELEAELVKTGGVIPDEPVEVEEPVAPEEVAAAEEEPAEAQAEEAGESHSVDDEPEQEELPDDRDLQLEEMRLRMDALKQERDHERFVAGQNAGRLGHLQKEIQRLSAERSASADDLGYDESPAESRAVQPQQRYSPEVEGEVAELRQELASTGVERAYSEFLNRIADDLKARGVEQDKLQSEQEAIVNEITPTLRERFEPFGNVAEMGIKSQQKVVRMVLEGAYTDHKLNKVAELRRTLAERRASQVADSRIVKQAAASSGSGGRPAKEPPPKSIEDMTAEEADAALVQEFGEGRGRLRARR